MEFETTAQVVCNDAAKKVAQPQTSDMSIRIYTNDGNYITVSGKDKIVFQWDN